MPESPQLEQTQGMKYPTDTVALPPNCAGRNSRKV